MSHMTDRIPGGEPSREAPGRAALRGRPFLALPLVLVNAAAIWGQAGWAYSHITSGGTFGLVVAVLFAGAIESIGIYLAYEAHEALMADQASGLLRFGSYAIGGLAGWLNFAHFVGQNHSQAVAFAGLSAVSPWLWAIWSRARNRERLAELELVDARGLKLSTSRKLWHPVRSLRVVRWAAWEGVTSPSEAVARWETREAFQELQGTGNEVPEPVPGKHRRSKAETLELIRNLREQEPDITQEAMARKLGITDRQVRKVLNGSSNGHGS